VQHHYNYEKWDQNNYNMRSHVLVTLPYLFQVVALLTYRKVKATLYVQGVMRLTARDCSRKAGSLGEH
jgi:hypothetical protein